MAQLVDEHSELSLLLIVLGLINQRDEILHNVSSRIPHRVDEDGGPELAAIPAAVVNFRIDLGATTAALDQGFESRQHLGSVLRAMPS